MACPVLRAGLRRLLTPEASERWTLYTWLRMLPVLGVAVLATWSLGRNSAVNFWPATLGTQLLGLALITAGMWAADYGTPRCNLVHLVLMQVGSALLGGGSVAALIYEQFYANLGDSIQAQLLQTCAQAFALVSLAVLALVPIRQAALPNIYAGFTALRKWHIRVYRKPRILVVTDLSVEAPGSCSICLNELWEDAGLDGVMRLGCGHLFHTLCINGWLDRRENCPSCRQSVSDLRRCTIIRQKQSKRAAPSLQSQQAGTMVTLLDGRSARLGDVLEPPVPVLSLLLPDVLGMNANVQSEATVVTAAVAGAARAPRTAWPGSVTLGAAPQAGARSELPSPVELRPHAYRPPRARTAPALSTGVVLARISPQPDPQASRSHSRSNSDLSAAPHGLPGQLTNDVPVL